MKAVKQGETPLMQQHNAIKARYPDAVLLFRVGDFYETFGGDAVIAARVLGITLTKRNNGAAASSELAGFPHHALDTYLHKLVRAGYRVAICDQLEDPKAAKGIVRRGVTEMVTPGTALNDKLLDFTENNFLAALHCGGSTYGLSFLDLSTGEFLTATGDREYAEKLLSGFRPAEVVFSKSFARQFKEEFGPKHYTYGLDEWIFTQQYAQDLLLQQFNTHSLKGFGIDIFHEGLIAAGAILHYLRETEHPHLQHLTSIQTVDRGEHLWMDRFTVRNLELLQGAGGGDGLLQVLDGTCTPMGARLLRRWVQFPLKDAGRIRERLDTVALFRQGKDLRDALTAALKGCGDLERLVSKVPLKRINPRELLQLARSLRATAAIRQLLSACGAPYAERLAATLNPCEYLSGRIEACVVDNPPAQAAKGGFIAPGVNAELDELRGLARDGRSFLAQLQAAESERTGITSLKVGFNNVFGYYLEVTHAHKTKVPAEWIRKQTLTGAERYITPELKEYEEKILGAEEKMLRLELQLFDELLGELLDFLQPVQTNAAALAILDCLASFAQCAESWNYVRPDIHEGDELQIINGRHPVIERLLPPDAPFVGNDLRLDKTEQQIIILTGPNMSGKSALLRQTGLITLMAHMGSFVPADSARVPLTDRIFTRVGASDNLSAGESTFMVEMNESASIINNISPRSLILLDEIGRGTATFDGISIAWSIAEFLHNAPQAPKTFFATHYHELNELEARLPRVRNYHITNREAGNKILFLRKLAPGGSTHSFGIHVARMAGMPPALVTRAEEVLKSLESKGVQPGTATVQDVPHPRMQLSIFDVHSQTFEAIRQVLDGLDINRLTPVEALLKLQEVKNMLK